MKTDALDAVSSFCEDFGCERFDFNTAGRRAFMLKPATEAADSPNPWVWFAPSLTGSQPNRHVAGVFVPLLASGFWIGGVDVGESYGSPQGRALFTGFYKVVCSLGFDSQVSLLAGSRGALMHYNWAAEHPEWVRCVGMVCPIMDLRCYPGLEKACAAYGMTATELSRHLTEHNPLDRLGPLAAHHIPIMHLHGDSDDLVPMKQNTGEAARRYREMGEELEVVVMKGKGHRPWSEFSDLPQLAAFFQARGKRRQSVGDTTVGG